MKNYLLSVWKLRHFWLALVRIDLRNRYRRSMIGMGWSLLQPIAMTVVICTVFSKIYNMDAATLKTFGPSLLAGLTMWNFIAASVNGGCQSFFKMNRTSASSPRRWRSIRSAPPWSAAVHLLLGLIVVALAACIMRGPDCLWTLPPCCRPLSSSLSSDGRWRYWRGR